MNSDTPRKDPTEYEPQRWTIIQRDGRVQVRSWPASHMLIAEVGPDTPENRVRAQLFTTAPQLQLCTADSTAIIRLLVETPQGSPQWLNVIRQAAHQVLLNKSYLTESGYNVASIG